MKDLKLEIIYLPTDELTPYENNAKLHPQAQIDKIKASIREFGMNDPIAICGKDNIIVEGHGRLLACQQLGIETVPVIRLDHLTDEQRRAYTLTHNKLTMNTDFDLEVLERELNNITLNMADFGFDDIDETMPEIEEDGFEFEEDEEAPEPKTKLGDIYQLGNHRLMCGDSTSQPEVDALMAEAQANMVFTDPPYGVAYSGGMQFKNGKAIRNNRQEILNDRALIYDISLRTILKHIDNGAFYVCYANSYSIEVLSQLRSIGLDQRSIIIWNKTNTGYGDLNSNYKCNYEPIFYGAKQGKSTNFVGNQNTDYVDEYEAIYYGVKKGKRTNFVGDTTQTTVWSIDKPRNNDLHPTMKPLALCAKAIFNSSRSGEIVVDLFGGSGSTLIACEKLGRKCYMMELDPHYVDVIIERWEKVTGKKAEKVN